MAKFWEIEEIGAIKPWSMEERLCEEHFQKYLTTAEDGRFTVSLPLKDSPNKLGESREMAIKRFFALERRLSVNDTLRKLYTDFLNTYEKLGHMTEVANEKGSKVEYFMPHHGVLKEASVTTKLRVVFDASAGTSTGLSLNDLQMTGPIIQQDLLSIILRFRCRKIILSSDIKMMYRQIYITPEQRSLQKIVWRRNPSEPVKTFELNTVTYGTTAASFLAIRCLHEIAAKCEDEHPIIADILRKDMYVDDLLTGVDTPEEARYIHENISKVLLKHGFELRKWQTNCSATKRHLTLENSSNTIDFSENKEYGTNKTLGLSWDSNSDFLSYKIQNVHNYVRGQVTKRIILSRIATIFDPLGLVSPCIIIAKTLLQKLWSEKLTWDQPVSDYCLKIWVEFSSELECLNSLTITRRILCENPSNISLHGFADASESSYGACVYIASNSLNGTSASNILCAKSKVAPIKTLTMPRLELCAALVLSQLISKVLDSLNININKVYCWSDSTIVLGWLKTPTNLLKTFVANLVAEIQKLTGSFEWRHVPTSENPADIVSRGLAPKQLILSGMWFHGPAWLPCESSVWPNNNNFSVNLPEKRKWCHVASNFQPFFPFDRYSNLIRLKRTFTYVLRFIKNCKKKRESRKTSYLTVDELNESFLKLIQLSQQESFAEAYATLVKKRELPSSSNILSLHPFIDKDGIMRVGGRLTNSDYPYSKKHPILLSPKHKITELIFEYEHKRLLHAGPQLLLSSIRETLWPISGRNIAKKTVRNCVKCSRYDSQNIQPIMGNLHEARIKPTTPFSMVGVDYAGPFFIKDKRGRGCKVIKSWVALFVCFSTRAIHLELVLSLSADDFLQAFNRFISRRGKPLEVFSDNGTNFIKANKDLKEMGTFLKNKSIQICESAVNLNIKWHFIPTNSPHFGGIWEAGVKSLKHHLRRVLGNYNLFILDFQTLLIRIEAILNSRPLFPLSACPDDLTSLTPAHFLIGRPFTTVPEPSITHVNDNRLTQFQLIQKLHEHFWNRWSREYISELQQRRQWKKNQGSLERGQLVLIKESNLPPTRWRLARVLDLIAGKDGVSRVASLKTADGIVTRAVVKLCPLPVVSQDLQVRGHVDDQN